MVSLTLTDSLTGRARRINSSIHGDDLEEGTHALRRLHGGLRGRRPALRARGARRRRRLRRARQAPRGRLPHRRPRVPRLRALHGAPGPRPVRGHRRLCRGGGGPVAVRRARGAGGPVRGAAQRRRRGGRAGRGVRGAAAPRCAHVPQPAPARRRGGHGRRPVHRILQHEARRRARGGQVGGPRPVRALRRRRPRAHRHRLARARRDHPGAPRRLGRARRRRERQGRPHPLRRGIPLFFSLFPSPPFVLRRRRCTLIALTLQDYVDDYEANVPFRALAGVGCRVEAACPTKRKGESCVTAIYDEPSHGVVASSAASEERRGHNFVLTADWADVTADDYDCVVVPGGRAPELLVTHDSAVALVREFADTGKLVASIDQGHLLLAAAGLLRGKKCASGVPMRAISRLAGAAAVEAEGAVADGKLVTAASWPDLTPFVAHLVELLGVTVSFC